MKQDAALGQNHGGKPQSDAKRLELGADLATSSDRAAGRGWNRYLAADGELRTLARYRGNRGLREDARNAIALEGLQGGAQSVGRIMRRQRCRVGKRRERIPVATSARDHAVDRERVELGEGPPTGR